MSDPQKNSANTPRPERLPWYAARSGDTVIYLLVAVLLVEMIVGGVCFFYGLMNAKPVMAGGPPKVDFPWLVWALASVLAPVGLLLLVHLAGTWVARTVDREQTASGGTAGTAEIPERLQRFYAMVNSAPTVVLLLGILVLGASLFFVEGAFTAIVGLLEGLSIYVPWIVGSLAALLAVCYLAQRYFTYRRLRMEHEYAFRQEVLERTGIVLVDKHTLPLAQNEVQQARLCSAESMQALPPVLDTETRTLPPAPDADSSDDDKADQGK